MRKTYKYVIELSKPVWPRHIVDELISQTGKVRDAKLLSVKDMQYDTNLAKVSFTNLGGEADRARYTSV